MEYSPRPRRHPQRGHGPTSAILTVQESKIGPYWPKDADTLAPGSFIHLALPDSFDVNHRQIGTQEEKEFLERIELAQREKTPELRQQNRRPNPADQNRNSTTQPQATRIIHFDNQLQAPKKVGIIQLGIPPATPDLFPLPTPRGKIRPQSLIWAEAARNTCWRSADLLRHLLLRKC